MRLKGKTALVTGANRGIGHEVCRQLGKEGANILMGVRDLDRASKSLKQITDEGIAASLIQVDVSDLNSVHHFLKSHSGQIDILINNAAIYDRASNLLSLDDSEFETVLRTNLIGAGVLAKNLAVQMKKQRWGRIVNVSSGMGSISDGFGANSPAYRVSKLALNGITISLAEALQGSGVLVNSVDPGWVRTDMGGKSATRSVEKGAQSVVWAAFLPDDGPTGGFFYDGRPSQW
jgi:NAD(P)-dependent dehydrogenase (short-subunit alcohol dehydrogenase family)